MTFDYSGSGHPVRPDLTEAYRAYWEKLAAPGSWWTGAERVAIADEARRARSCALCRERKAALSPFAVDGEHDHAGVLSDPAVDAVHRLVTDASRLSKSWLEKLFDNGLSDAHYVELLGIVVADHQYRRLSCVHWGSSSEPLPGPKPGEAGRLPPRFRGAGRRMGRRGFPPVARTRVTGGRPVRRQFAGAERGLPR